jgi:hypothetical protein
MAFWDAMPCSLHMSIDILEKPAAYIFRIKKCHFSTLKVEAEGSSDRLVPLYNIKSHSSTP